ncbi:hypothetical protein CLV78_102725 [Aliiruegeria haliotis]|uniref:Glycosyltransferase 2-like domain-containing protein n=1 Tax=Aliiruegeria haliotis TaxID=1280846 RepID=A0A2T0RWH8_9RHOB|nr:TIGR04283 family arsenosugar biosynthesis glycosyltransferase [Aliiruegeria haliotis]PRY25545.1 hypothetical protein CLV78_102725 [Aliiruegeria haliotis]
MPAPLSVVIPTLNAEAALRECLPGVMEGVATGLVREVVVSDGGSTDASVRLARATGAVVIEGTAGRGGQLARGIAASRGGWILALHADSQLPTGWPEQVREAMEAPTKAHVFRLAFRSRGMPAACVAGWANLRTRFLGLPYGDQGMLISRSLYDEVGGYPDIPLMEDVALARALRGRLRMLPATVTTSATRYEAEGWIRRGARNLGTLARYLAGTAPETLVARYETRRTGSGAAARGRSDT